MTGFTEVMTVMAEGMTKKLNEIIATTEEMTGTMIGMTKKLTETNCTKWINDRMDWKNDWRN